MVANIVTAFGSSATTGSAGPAVDVWEEEVIQGGGARSPRAADDGDMWEEEEIADIVTGDGGLAVAEPARPPDIRPRSVGSSFILCP